jgi:2-polyprenyl-3-methyl-5-hydroxy-6-metoxy-1,4-benzoquinol methylase
MNGAGCAPFDGVASREAIERKLAQHQEEATMPAPGPSPALFFDTVNAYQRTEALRSAIELDLFTQVGAGRRTAEQLAAACQASPRGVRILADYLTILGFLRKETDAYHLTPDAEAFLDRRAPGYLGDALEFLLAEPLRESFRHLTAAVRRGGTAISEEGTVSPDNPIWETFARAMAPLMALPARLLADLIGGDRQQPLRLLDVAAGHGMFGIRVAERFPHAQVTALDWPGVLTVAAENARRAGVGVRHALLPGSAFEIDWGGPYEIVLLTNFLHHFDLPTCGQLAAKAHAALVPGGRVFTLEFVLEPDRITPPSAAGFALMMLATTARGDAYTFAEYQAVFAEVGFHQSEFHPLPPSTQQVVVTYKS